MSSVQWINTTLMIADDHLRSLAYPGVQFKTHLVSSLALTPATGVMRPSSRVLE